MKLKKRSRFPWDILLAFAFGVVIFAFLVMASSGVLVSVVVIVAAFGIFALFHFWIWGRTSLKTVAQDRPEEKTGDDKQAQAANLEDEFTLVLNEQERTELIEVLEQSLASSVGSHHHAQTKAPKGEPKKTIQEVLNRTKGFGA